MSYFNPPSDPQHTDLSRDWDRERARERRERVRIDPMKTTRRGLFRLFGAAIAAPLFPKPKPRPRNPFRNLFNPAVDLHAQYAQLMCRIRGPFDVAEPSSMRPLLHLHQLAPQLMVPVDLQDVSSRQDCEQKR